MLEERQLQKDIKECVNSEDFLWAFLQMIPDPPEQKVCPLCLAPVLQQDDEGLRCKRCGWNEASINKLWEFKARIRHCRLKRRGIKHWFEIHKLECPASCTLETPHNPNIKT